MTSWWRPDRFAKKRNNLEARAKIFRAIRSYFDGQGFFEVDTPALQISPGLEPHLTAFETRYVTPHGDSHTLYLATSPEFSCKKLLVAGMERIYQLSHVFRNAEGSSRHHPEFTLLEWYRVGAGYDELMQDCEQLLKAAGAVTCKTIVSYNGIACDMTKPAERLSVQDAFKRFVDIDLLGTIDDPHDPKPERLRVLAHAIGIRTHEDDRWDDIALRILGEKIEPYLGKDRPCFLMDYPLCMAALSRPKPTDGRVAERFELYVSGLELANAFVELTDPKIQRARFEADMDLKQQIYGTRYPIDEDFLKALEHGMPDAAGIALGVDRLVMLAAGTENIDDVVWAPVAHT
jgi:lysyl-tRNA synthetase class 2